MADILLVIAPKDFSEKEYFDTKEELVQGGHKVFVSSLEDIAVGNGEEPREVVVDLLLEECDAADYDGVVFLGGMGAEVYFDNEKAMEMAFQTFEQGKLIGAICIAPTILANAGVIDGRKATSFKSQKETLEENGAFFTSDPVVVDENIITANGPESAHLFGQKIVEVLLQESTASKSSEEESKEQVGDEDF